MENISTLVLEMTSFFIAPIAHATKEREKEIHQTKRIPHDKPTKRKENEHTGKNTVHVANEDQTSHTNKGLLQSGAPNTSNNPIQTWEHQHFFNTDRHKNG